MTTRDTLFSVAIFGALLAAVLRIGEDAGFGPLPRVIALAVFAVAPLALLSLREVGGKTRRLVRVASMVLPVPASLVVISFTREASAGLWTVGWLLMTGLLAVIGITHLREGRWSDPARWPVSAGLIMVPIGAAWLFASRAEMEVLGFSGLLVLLTAVHFHFAALGALAIVSRVVAALDGRARRLASACAVGAVFGIPVVAVGLLVSPLLALLGAAWMAISLLGVAVLMIGWVRPRLRRRSSRWLVSISGLSLVLSVPLAVHYRYGQWSEAETVGIEWMLRLHGYANAHGVVTCGLFAFALEDRLE